MRRNMCDKRVTNGADMTTTTCQRCNGIGRINAFAHYASGTCFGCQGTGTVRANAAECGSGAKQASRNVDVDGATVCVFRFGAGFRADEANGRGSLWFDIDGRTLVNVERSTGMPPARAERIIATLTERCRA